MVISSIYGPTNEVKTVGISNEIIPEISLNRLAIERVTPILIDRKELDRVIKNAAPNATITTNGEMDFDITKNARP